MQGKWSVNFSTPYHYDHDYCYLKHLRLIFCNWQHFTLPTPDPWYIQIKNINFQILCRFFLFKAFSALVKCEVNITLS